MSYVVYRDYKFHIQQDTLQEAIGQDNSVLVTAQLSAVEEASSYIRAKYDITQEFTDTLLYDPTYTSYTGNSRVYLDAPAWVQANAYPLKSLVLFTDGNIYQNIVAIGAGGEVWTPAHWLLLGAEFSLFYVPLPFPSFSFDGTYLVGSQVYWKGKTYTAIRGTIGVDHDSQIQINQSSTPNFYNYAPDDPVYGAQFWGTPTAFSVVAGALPGSPWIAGDNRSQQMLMYVVDIVMYHIHQRVAPRNIPELRIARYMGLQGEIKLSESGAIFPRSSALGWLQSVQRGDNIPTLAKVQPSSTGNRIKWASDQKQGNDYL